MISFSLLKEIKTRGVGDYPSTSIINLKLNIMKYYIQDVLNAKINLTPLHCKFCDSNEVVFNQYINDASCQSCGEWQDD